MGRPVLVDSSVFIGLARRGIHPLDELLARAHETDWATCGMVRLEVVRGIRDAKSQKHFRDFFDLLINVPTNNRIWDSASELAWTLDRQGVVLPAPDIVIACCARFLDAAILTFDRHFEKIPGLEVFSTLDDLR